MNDLQTPSCMKCPFCLDPIADSNPGEKFCQSCHAEFEIDDRRESVFTNPDNLRLPANGTVCRTYGLVQGTERNSCGYCRAELYVTSQ